MKGLWFGLVTLGLCCSSALAQHYQYRVLIGDRDAERGVLYYDYPSGNFGVLGICDPSTNQFDYYYGIAVHPQTGEIWIANVLRNRIDVLDQDGNCLRTITSGLPRPHGIAIHPNGNKVVTSHNAFWMSEYDIPTGQWRFITFAESDGEINWVYLDGIYGIRWHPNGEVLYATAKDGVAEVLANGELLTNTVRCHARYNAFSSAWDLAIVNPESVELIGTDDVWQGVNRPRVRQVGQYQFSQGLFDKLYTFLKRYISEETGSIGFFFTPYHQSVYEQVYTDTQDVILFWKTQRLYYVKTDRLFRSMETEVDGFKFFFDASTLEHKKANEKRELVFEFKEIRPADGAFVFTMGYSERGRQTSLDTIRRAIRDALGLSRYTDAVPSEETLERAFRVFERQSEVDYFLCKDAKSFLREQFDLWMWQYLLGKPGEEPQTEWNETRLKQLQALKRIAYRVIDYIAAFEDELVKIWNKPKFVLNSNYVITLDRIVAQAGGWELLEAILAHPHLEQQIQEWRELGMVGDDFTPTQIMEGENLIDGKQLNRRYQYLPIDTRYFKDLELRILGLFDHLDDALDGWLIKSENYQALNTILPKWRGRVQCIYIDPPFNKEQEADYHYTVKYKDTTWCTMLYDRLNLAKELLSSNGTIYVRCDHNGDYLVRSLLNEVFGRKNFLNQIVIRKGKRTESTERNRYENDTEMVYLYARESNSAKLTILKKEKPESEQSWTTMFFPQERGDPNRHFWGVTIRAPQGLHWQFTQERIDQEIANGNIRIVCLKCKYIHTDAATSIDACPQCGSEEFRAEYCRREVALNNDWTDILGYTYSVSLSTGFQTENSEALLKRVILGSTDVGEVVMDFFLGSGTTVEVAHKLRRRWIGMEMGNHFDTVVLPRLKKVLAYDKSGISKDKDVAPLYNPQSAGGFFKYYHMEDYDTTLRWARYSETVPEMLTETETVLAPQVRLAWVISPEEATVDANHLNELLPQVDIAETLSNLRGKPIRQLRIEPEQSKPVLLLEGETVPIPMDKVPLNYLKPTLFWR